MGGPIITTLVLFGALTVGVGSPALAGEPPRDGCATQTFVTFSEQDGDIAPGTYTQAGPPAVSVTFGSLASRMVSYEVTTAGWRIFTADISYVYDDVEGGALGQADSYDYPAGVTSASETAGGVFVPGDGLLGWESAIFQLFNCGAPTPPPPPTTTTPPTPPVAAPPVAAPPVADPPTTTPPTTAPPTTTPPTTAPPTTAPPTTTIAAALATPTTATPTTTIAAALAAPTLPATGGKADVAMIGLLALLGGLGLAIAARRSANL